MEEVCTWLVRIWLINHRNQQPCMIIIILRRIIIQNLIVIKFLIIHETFRRFLHVLVFYDIQILKFNILTLYFWKFRNKFCPFYVFFFGFQKYFSSIIKPIFQWLDFTFEQWSSKTQIIIKSAKNITSSDIPNEKDTFSFHKSPKWPLFLQN